MRFQLSSLLLLASTGLSLADETKYTIAFCRDHSTLAPGSGNYPLIYGEEAKRICEAANGTFCGEDSCVVEIGDQTDKYKTSCSEARAQYKAQIDPGSKTLDQAKQDAFCT